MQRWLYGCGHTPGRKRCRPVRQKTGQEYAAARCFLERKHGLGQIYYGRNFIQAQNLEAGLLESPKQHGRNRPTHSIQTRASAGDQIFPDHRRHHAHQGRAGQARARAGQEPADVPRLPRGERPNRQAVSTSRRHEHGPPPPGNPPHRPESKARQARPGGCRCRPSRCRRSAGGGPCREPLSRQRAAADVGRGQLHAEPGHPVQVTRTRCSAGT
mmetsp:Transcript_49426/g.103113  ORF Transcript_49426/g.103113 Transcript_49426/m.103113 type:complete len:214 (-) Transcript_49426:122-763(-)